ncbi:unnamed protein product [Alternaria alternata]
MSRPLLPESAYAALGLSPEAIKDLMNPKPPPPEPPEIHAPNLLQSDEDNARPMSPNETSITLYAELLLHIRTVTLFASLRTNFSRSTDAKLSSDGSYITVSHEGQSASIRLPVNIEGGGEAALELPSQPPTKELTLRLQLEEREGSDLLGALQREDRQANIVPWDGASLNDAQDVELTCKSCEGVIVSKGKIRQWKDLPNENWAEMMDFWHCHKPDEHHLHDHSHDEVVGQKGYAAGNRLQAVDGVGFVDLASFLLAEQDCDGAQIFYQKQTWQALKPGEPESAQVEDVEFPEELYEELKGALERSQRLLPPTAKKFQGWDVGLLERFEVLEAGMGNLESEDGLNEGVSDKGKPGGNELECEIPSEDVD